MTDQTRKIYVDTSVFGGVFDEGFDSASARLFDAVRAGVFLLVTSEIVREEIAPAPESVCALFREMIRDAVVAPISAEALRLQEAYEAAGILTPQWKNDALHVALATVSGCDMIVSWNFSHIVNFRKIPLYNAVNVLQGYGSLQIYSPLEVVGDDND
jgi:predicted nucleic acid-binding protein